MSVHVKSLDFNAAFAALGDSYADNKKAVTAASDLFEQAKKNKQIADASNDPGKIGQAAEDFSKAKNYLKSVISANAEENNLINEILNIIGRA